MNSNIQALNPIFPVLDFNQHYFNKVDCHESEYLPMKHLQSLREYVDTLKEIGEVQEINDELRLGSSFAGTYHKELQGKVLQNWQLYGFY